MAVSRVKTAAKTHYQPVVTLNIVACGRQTASVPSVVTVPVHVYSMARGRMLRANERRQYAVSRVTCAQCLKNALKIKAD